MTNYKLWMQEWAIALGMRNEWIYTLARKGWLPKWLSPVPVKVNNR